MIPALQTETVRSLPFKGHPDNFPPAPPVTASQNLDLLARYLRRDLETVVGLNAEALIGFAEVELTRAAVEAAAALRKQLSFLAAGESGSSPASGDTGGRQP